jgi:nicotinamide mononucleotide transporter
MGIGEILDRFVTGMKATGPLEYIGVTAGIVSVLFSRVENIWVYPTGIISTLIYIFISFEGGLYAEAGLNIYYTIMSIFGWYMWVRKKSAADTLHITRSNRHDWLLATGFFTGMYLLLFFILKKYTPSTVPAADAFASATAYTGMLLMNKKKIEHWFWWILTNVVSIVLFFIKGYVFTSVQFVVLLLLAISGWLVWERKYKARQYENG